MVIDALPKKNYRGIPGITWELRRDRGSPTFFGNPVTGKSKPRLVDGFCVPTLQFGGGRYHRSHVLDEISGVDDGAVVLRDGGDLAVCRVESVGACGTIDAGDWVKNSSIR